MKIFKRILIGLLIVTSILVLGFIIWAETPLGPEPEALAALESDTQVTVIEDDFITFQPVNVQPDSGLVFYPGGRVDYRSYAAPLHEIAAQGYLVVVVPVRLNLAFFEINAAEPVLAAYPEIQHWAVGGHSLGGVVSSLFAKEHPTEVEGLVFWASYPSDDALKNSEIQVVSIYGTNDMAGMKVFEDSKTLLPVDTQFIIIDGGNHAQFGDYGPQPGDNPATISREEQQAQAVRATANLLKEFAK